MQKTQTLDSDIAIIGGSLAAVAAALAALDAGYTVILTEASDWLGGQVSSQGVSALDEHALIEDVGGTRRYYQFRERIRDVYENRYGLRVMNPGNGWVSQLCFEPRVAEQVIREMLEPYLQTSRLHILYKSRVLSATVTKQLIQAVEIKTAQARFLLKAAYFLDASDLGELLPLTKTAYVSGAEGQVTGETDATEANPEEVQSFTYCFALEYCPGEKHLIAKPPDYEQNRDRQPYTLKHDGGREYKMFCQGAKGELPFWSYRRLFDASQFGSGNDIALINWPGNDYRFANLIDKPLSQQRKILKDAKNLSLGFLYWLQTECPRDEGGYGYPEFKLRKDIMGSRDGLSKQPYIRESRRIKALETITADSIFKQPGRARAQSYPNSVGIGWYSLDLHRANQSDAESVFKATAPFQLPLGAIIPEQSQNLLAACKNIGTTHLSNGAYRLHPIEWAIGEAAASLAAFCLRHKQSPHQVWQSQEQTRALQMTLLEQGIPIAWTSTIGLDHPNFKAAQLFALSCIKAKRAETLELDVVSPLSATELADFTEVLRAFGVAMPKETDSLAGGLANFVV